MRGRTVGEFCERVAEDFRARLPLASERRWVAPALVFSALGIRQSPFVPKGCHGLVVIGERSWVRIDQRGHPQRVAQRGCHECGHLAQSAAAVERPHREDLTTLVGAMVAMPRAPLLAALADAGGWLDELARAYPDALPSLLYARLAFAVGGAAVFHRGRSRWVVSATGREDVPLDTEFREQALCDSVRRRGNPARDSAGLSAAAFRDPGEPESVVVLVPGHAT